MVIFFKEINTNLPKPFPYNNFRNYSPDSPVFLAFSECIVVIAYIHRHLSECKSMYSNLLDKLRCILHSIHCERNYTHSFHMVHAVSIVGVREFDPGDHPGKYFTSPKDTPTYKWHIRLCLTNKARSKNNIELE
jgi:hypothetical protein